MVIKIRELLRKGKSVITFTIKNFYQQKTNSKRKMIEAIQEWVKKKKKKEVKSKDYKEDNKNNEDINISNNIINNNSSSNSENWIFIRMPKE